MKINLMEWGIVNSKNYNGDIRDIPIKVFDEIYFTWKGRKVGKYSIYSKIRGKRVKEKSSDPFLDVLKGKREDIVICVDGKEYMNPLSEEPEIMCLDNVESASIINRYSPFVRIIEKDIEKEIEKQLNKNEYIAKGIAIVCFPREYKEDIHELSLNSLESFLYTMKSSILYVKRFVEDASIYPFFNIGKLSGGSIKHIHSQVYFDNTPGIGINAYTTAKSFEKVCNICKEKKYVLFKGEHFTCYLPDAMERNIHVRIKTNEHIESFEELNLLQIRELSYILSLISSSLYELYGIEEKNIILRTKQPFFKNFHTFIDVLPFEIVGGGERSESMKINSFSKDEKYKEISKYLNSFFDF